MALAKNIQSISKEKIIDDGEGNEDILRKIVSPEYPENPYEILGIWKFNPPQVVLESEIGTPVQEFYRNATIFLTGGTGFLGVTLIEKLLRSCPHIKRIYMLVRNKRNVSSEKRYETYFQNEVSIRFSFENLGCNKGLEVQGVLKAPQVRFQLYSGNSDKGLKGSKAHRWVAKIFLKPAIHYSRTIEK